MKAMATSTNIQLKLFIKNREIFVACSFFDHFEIYFHTKNDFSVHF